MSRAYNYMMRLLIALQMYRQLQEALFHTFECPEDEDEDRFDSENLGQRLEDHRRLILLDKDLAS